MIKTRFAPSPTGFLHIGGFRTALFAYLYAKKNGGKFLLRIEDTDRERFMEGGIENILQSLYWAGIKPDEGVCLDKKQEIVTQAGKNGPYIQSERLDIYKKYIEQLLEIGGAYHCFCSKERLDELRQTQEANKIAPGYDGHCLKLSADEVNQRLESGEKSVIRLKMPKEGTISFNDLVRGKVEFKNDLIDDQVLIKSDGYPTYHFTVVVDDHLMEITHIVRGEEWLSSTPKHLTLYKMFGWKPPEFAHLSLLVNEQKQKLSKRHGDVSVEDFKEQGYLPEALVNFVAFLGWNPGDEREIFGLKDLEKEFSLDRVGKPAAIFNRSKLDWYNGQYLKKMNLNDLADKATPVLQNEGLIKAGEFEIDWLAEVLDLAKDRLVKLADLPELIGFIFAENLDYEPSLLVWKKSTPEQTKEKMAETVKFLENIDNKNWNKKYIEAQTVKWIEKNNLSVGEILWPMRVALSGKKNSPGPFEIAGVLGKAKSLKRLNDALGRL